VSGAPIGEVRSVSERNQRGNPFWVLQFIHNARREGFMNEFARWPFDCFQEVVAVLQILPCALVDLCGFDFGVLRIKRTLYLALALAGLAGRRWYHERISLFETHNDGLGLIDLVTVNDKRVLEIDDE
jgi:hypothetical protein